jgi:lauroyl/myristoyl acyltransferase
MVLSWPDHLREPRWRRRFSVTGFQGLRELADRGPVILFSLHTVPAYVLPPWVRTLGIQAASVAVDPGWFEEDILRRSALSQPGSARTTFAIGEARALVRHLQAGHCLILFADHPAGHTVDVDWRGSSLRLSTGGFRLAAQTGATVVPVAITTSGRWRYRVHVGQPLPEDVVRAGDQLPAARLVVNELMTALAETPQQADLTLIDSLRPQRPAAAAA